ncbi:hypothetical protein LJR260_003640 [Variovorax paradoxus]|uniref:hypothetical protein n=1 Tax=Variovorax paradoxus TaxID=34073 RepID=UPI003ECFA699
MIRATDVLQDAIEARADEAQSKRRSDMSQAELQKWMIDEANRLIEARRQIERPARPVWTNQIHHPEDAKYDPERSAISDAAAQVAARMAQRDNADENARW